MARGALSTPRNPPARRGVRCPQVAQAPFAPRSADQMARTPDSWRPGIKPALRSGGPSRAEVAIKYSGLSSCRNEAAMSPLVNAALRAPQNRANNPLAGPWRPTIPHDNHRAGKGRRAALSSCAGSNALPNHARHTGAGPKRRSNHGASQVVITAG